MLNAAWEAGARQCWADVLDVYPPGPCAAPLGSGDPLGLCPAHRAEILGAAAASDPPAPPPSRTPAAAR